MTVHQLAPALFERIAGGSGGTAAITEMRAAQYSKHLMLVRYLLGQWRTPAADEVRDLLDRARQAAPDAFREVIGAPLTGAWAAIVARGAMQEKAADADLAHLAAIALVAASAAGIDGTVRLPVHEGRAVLPGLGAFEVGDHTEIEAMTTGGRIVAVVGDEVLGTDGPRWLPVHTLTADTAGKTLTLGLDDLHPYRHGHHVPPANRLGEPDLERWRTVFAEAWTLLATCLPERADELATGLRTLVPLVQLDPRSARSATLRHAFGVFGLTLPPSPAEFAVTLVHEFAHSKLSAVLDVNMLTDPSDTERYFAPWRTDPRPLAGLLQGVYAFAAVADTWRGLRPAVPVAERRFAEARIQVDRGLTAVEASGSLTPDGRRFVAALRDFADELLAEPVPPAVAQAAEEALAITHAAWLNRNEATTGS